MKMHHHPHLNANVGLEKNTYIDYSSSCGFIMAVYCMAATICIMITIREYTILTFILKRHQTIMEQKGEKRQRKGVQCTKKLCVLCVTVRLQSEADSSLSHLEVW